MLPRAFKRASKNNVSRGVLNMNPTDGMRIAGDLLLKDVVCNFCTTRGMK